MASPRVIIVTPIILTLITAAFVILYVSPSVTTENVEIISKYVTWNPSQVQYEAITTTGMLKRISISNFWEVIITLKNKGESEASLTDVLINHKPPSEFKPSIICMTKIDDNPAYLTYNIIIKSGENAKIILLIPFQESELNHGKLIEIRIRTQTRERAIVLTLP